MKSQKVLFRVNSIVSVFLLIAVMAAGSGFSYTIHFCHGSRSDFAIYPELTHAVAGCGCEKKDLPGKISSQVQSVNIHKSGCCKNLHFFQKISTVSFQQIFPDFSPQCSIISATDMFESIASGLADIFNSSVVERHYPPPISGKALVYFLNQLRIPSISGIS